MALAAVALAALGGMMFSTAQQSSRVGYIDIDGIVNAYAGVELTELVKNEVSRLQGLFDEESQGLAEEEKLALFAEYEQRLEEYKENVGFYRVMGDIEKVVEEVAAQQGVDVIIDVSVVVWGGVDLTPIVAQRLGLLGNPTE